MAVVSKETLDVWIEVVKFVIKREVMLSVLNIRISLSFSQGTDDKRKQPTMQWY